MWVDSQLWERFGDGSLVESRLAKLVFSAFLLWSVHIHAQNAPVFSWASRGGGEADDVGTSVVVERTGHIYVTGYTRSTNADFQTAAITNSGGTTMFLAKYTPSGALAWIRQADAVSRAVALDGAGNAYVVGSFGSLASFGTQTLNTTGSHDIFVVKYDPDGNALWARSAGGPGNDRANAIIVDAATNIYITGGFEGTASFGTNNLVTAGRGDMFVARLNHTGDFVWAQRAGGPLNEVGNAMGVDALGNVYVCGSFYGNASFGSTNLTGGDNWPSLFIAKYSSAGEVIWAREGTSGGACYPFAAIYGTAMAVDANNNVHVSGRFAGCARFGDTVLESGQRGDLYSYGYDALLVKLDSNGNFLWVFASGDWSWDEAWGVATDRTGNCYLTGFFEYAIDFGSTRLSSVGYMDAFVAKFNEAGEVLWAVRGGGGGDEQSLSMGLGPGNSICLTGKFWGAASFGDTQLTNTGTWDMFVAKLEPPPMLSIVRASNKLLLSWPTNSSGFTPEACLALSRDADWVAITNTPAIIGEENVVTTELVGATRFFRLHKQ